MKSFYIVTGLAVILAISACNSGTSRRSGGRQCPSKYEPISMKLGNGQTQLSLMDATQLSPGTYEYQGATIYYVDFKTDFRIEVIDAKDSRTGQFKAAASCVRNPTADSLGFNAQGISKLEVAPDFKTFYDVRTFTFTNNGKAFLAKSEKGPEKVGQSPDKAYDGVKERILVKKNATDIEIRSMNQDTAGKYMLVVRLKLTKKLQAVPQVPAEDAANGAF